MIKQAMTMAAWVALSAAPAIVRAQTTTPPTTTTPEVCDCPVGDARGDQRNLAAFAPLGLLGALAAAGGSTPFLAAATPATTPATAVATNAPAAARPGADPDVSVSETARNATPEATGGAPSMNVRNIPEPVSPDSMRAGLRAPNTGTPLPSVFLIGTGLIAVGCVTVLRTRS